MNLKKEVISLKELILLGILIILVVYYFVFHGPIKEQTEECEGSLVKINSELQISQQKAVEKKKMQKLIDDIFDEYDGHPPMTPEYNNINHIIGELNGILGNTYDYHLSFGEESIDAKNNNIIRRPITISFSTHEYDDAVSKIKTINESKNNYLIQNVSVFDSSSDSSGSTDQFGYPVDSAQNSNRYDIVMTMTSFEYKADAPASHEDISE